jgi:uncharacterized Zn-binding protein involved in type VI secretion
MPCNISALGLPTSGNAIMAERKFIVLGDRSTHGGMVVTASTNIYIDGKRVACVGDKVTCPRCKGLHSILPGEKQPPVLWEGKWEIACENDPVSDGSKLMSVGQFNAVHIDGSGKAEWKTAGGAGAEEKSVAVAALRAGAGTGSGKTMLEEGNHGKYSAQFLLLDEASNDPVTDFVYGLEHSGAESVGEITDGMTETVMAEDAVDVGLYAVQLKVKI